MATTTDKIQLEIELSNGKKAGQTLNELTGTAAKLTRELKNLKPGTEEFINKSKDLQAVNSRIKGVKDEMYGASAAAKNLAGQFGHLVPFGSQFQQLGQAVGSISPALNTGSKAANIFRMALIAIPLMAVIAAITGLIQWFKRTEEGAQKLRIITAAVGQVFQSIWDVASKLGKIIWDAFTSPKKAISGIGDAIKEFVLSRIELLMSGVKGIGTAFSLLMDGKFKAAAKEAGNSFVEIQRAINPVAWAIEGTVNTTKALGKAAKEAYAEIKSDVQGAIALQERENKLKVDKRNFLVQEAKLEAELAEAKLRGVDQTLSAIDREKELARAIELQKQLVGERTRLATEEYLIQKERNALSDTSEADMEKEVQLQADIIRLRKQGADQMKEIFGQQTGLQKQVAAQQEQVRQKELAADKALFELKLELMDEGTEKEIAKINYEYEQKIAAIEGNEAQITEMKALLEADQAEQIAEVRRAKEEELRLEDEELQAELLVQKFEKAVITEDEFQTALFEFKKEKMLEQLEELRLLHGEESLEYVRKNNELLKLHNEHNTRIKESDKKLEEEKQRIREAGYDGARSIMQLGLELLGEEEAGKGKHANALKAFAAGEMTANFIQETQAIWMNAEKNPLNALFPAAGKIIAIVKIIAAGARLKNSMAKLTSQKFALGDIIKGPKHSQGGIDLIDKSGRHYGEMEGDEIILTGNVSRSPIGRQLASNLNSMFGGRKFALGGPVNPLAPNQVTSVSNVTQQTNQVTQSFDVSGLREDMQGLRSDFQTLASRVDQWPTSLKVGVAVGEIEDAMTVRSDVRQEAEF